MAQTYAYKRDFSYPVKVEDGQAELERIRNKHGLIKTQNIVDESRPDYSILHNIFEWNDSVGAERFRNAQAASYIRSIITVEQEQIVRAFHNVTIVTTGDNSEVKKDRGYLPIEIVMDNGMYWDQIIDQAKNDLLSFRAKYYKLMELSEVMKQLEPIFKTIDQLDCFVIEEE